MTKGTAPCCGGVYLLDYLNAIIVQTTLVPEGDEERNGTTYKVRRRIEDGRVVKDVEIHRGDETLAYTESVQLYIHNELVEMMAQSGLDVVASYGDFDGSDFTTDAPRCILVARKP